MLNWNLTRLKPLARYCRHFPATRDASIWSRIGVKFASGLLSFRFANANTPVWSRCKRAPKTLSAVVLAIPTGYQTKCLAKPLKAKHRGMQRDIDKRCFKFNKAPYVSVQVESESGHTVLEKLAYSVHRWIINKYVGNGGHRHDRCVHTTARLRFRGHTACLRSRTHCKCLKDLLRTENQERKRALYDWVSNPGPHGCEPNAKQLSKPPSKNRNETMGRTCITDKTWQTTIKHFSPYSSLRPG